MEERRKGGNRGTKTTPRIQEKRKKEKQKKNKKSDNTNDINK
jgi:hypothetical protein